MGDHGTDETASINPAYRLGLFLLFVVAGLLVFYLSVTFAPAIPEDFRATTQIALVATFLALSWILYRNPQFHKYWPVSFGVFVAACAIILSTYAGDWGLWLSDLEFNTPNGFAVLKLSEDLAIVLCIVLLTKIVRQDLGTIFLKRGNLKLGLAVGLTTFLAFSLLAVLQSGFRSLGVENALSLAPAIAATVLADGFTEELLFRGLFLRKLTPLLGRHWSNVATATVFALVHIQVEFGPVLPVFLVAVFSLGLLCGWIMQATESILAPALFHAGVIMLIILDAFAAYGAV